MGAIAAHVGLEEYAYGFTTGGGLLDPTHTVDQPSIYSTQWDFGTGYGAPNLSPSFTPVTPGTVKFLVRPGKLLTENWVNDPGLTSIVAVPAIDRVFTNCSGLSCTTSQLFTSADDVDASGTGIITFDSIPVQPDRKVNLNGGGNGANIPLSTFTNPTNQTAYFLDLRTWNCVGTGADIPSTINTCYIEGAGLTGSVALYAHVRKNLSIDDGVNLTGGLADIAAVASTSPASSTIRLNNCTGIADGDVCTLQAQTITLLSMPAQVTCSATPGGLPNCKNITDQQTGRDTVGMARIMDHIDANGQTNGQINFFGNTGTIDLGSATALSLIAKGFSITPP